MSKFLMTQFVSHKDSPANIGGNVNRGRPSPQLWRSPSVSLSLRPCLWWTSQRNNYFHKFWTLDFKTKGTENFLFQPYQVI